ncbi:MAG: hypothetical protein NVS1B9_03580 [Solirubrobacteraceae bacterium]
MSHAVKTLLASCLLAACLPAGASAQSTTIAPGVSVAGIDLSGLTVDAAAARLTAALAPRLAATTFVGAGGRVFRLSPAQAGEKFDAMVSAKRALALGHAGAAPPDISHSHVAVRRFVAQVAAAVDRSPRDATLSIALQRIYRRAGRDGHALAQDELAKGIDAALDAPDISRVFHVKLVKRRPRLGLTGLSRAYPTILTVDRRHFKLRVFRRLRLLHSYRIAVGRAGLQTPTGLYHIREREVNPSWHVPNSAWAGALAGKTIPPGPGDPLVARWMGLADGIGIHGTNEPFSIGSAASHGCIRMLVSDVKAVYRLTSLGTPVLIR